jgi:hypothetical protein
VNALTTIEDLLNNPNVQIRTADFILALILSVVSALIIAALYHIFYENRATGSRIHRSFLLISPSITALFVAIQFSLPLSLGLVGALTIIRFRTPIKEPEEVAFIMLVIATSIVCATFHYLLLGILMALAIVVLLIQKYIPVIFSSGRNDGLILITLDGNLSDDARQALMDRLRERVRGAKIRSISMSEKVTSIHVSFAGVKTQDLEKLTPELRKVAPVSRINVYFNGQGVLN